MCVKSGRTRQIRRAARRMSKVRHREYADMVVRSTCGQSHTHSCRGRSTAFSPKEVGDVCA
ncbi:hypothetical protein THER5_2055 [Bifidobacterium thermacidophilum subsp. thermacidophilum]|uniref:Uncharacterized protein n=1 Tax=Bifidobacterium thermacidophilum subsp. thermacidophilum TaxID=79262 RepID=A0A087E2Y4_9BIFI|nr:hypothetical protein THER5_2055 [Bifidobacterium thermacidophilum subsp. thermacidophilum]